MENLEQFREETRQWLRANAPQSMFTPVRAVDDLCWGGRKTPYPPDVKRWLDVMAERGWTAPTWPKQYGGGGLNKAEAKILSQEMAKLGLRAPLVGFGLTMIGPLLLQAGSEDLKRIHMPRIVRIYKMVENNYLFTLRFVDDQKARSFRHQPGQFVMLSVPGSGEIPISISSSPVPGPGFPSS